MAILEIPRDPSPRTLAVFGLLLGGVFASMAAILTWRAGWGRGPQVLLGVSVLLPAIYYLRPALRRPIYLGWVYAAWPIGTTLSFVLLLLIWILVVTPLGLLRRRYGKDPLARGLDARAPSYWQPHASAADPTDPDMGRYFKPY